MIGPVSRCDIIVKAARTGANVCGIDAGRNRENVPALENKPQSLHCNRLVCLSWSAKLSWNSKGKEVI